MQKMIEQIIATVQVSTPLHMQVRDSVNLVGRIEDDLARNIAGEMLRNDKLPVYTTKEYVYSTDCTKYTTKVHVIDAELYQLIRSTGDYKFWSMMCKVDAARLNDWLEAECGGRHDTFRPRC